MSVDVKAHLFEYPAGNLLTILNTLKCGSLPLWQLFTTGSVPLFDLLVYLVDLVKKNRVMQDTHLFLISIIVGIQGGKIVLSIEKLIQKTIILRLILCNVQSTIISDIIWHAILIIELGGSERTK